MASGTTIATRLATGTGRGMRNVENIGDEVVAAMVYRRATMRTRGPDEHENACQHVYTLFP
jgi:hypothetical protein